MINIPANVTKQEKQKIKNQMMPTHKDGACFGRNGIFHDRNYLRSAIQPQTYKTF